VGKGEEVNPVLAGYFSNLITCLHKYKKYEMMKFLLKTKYFSTIIDHIYDQSIAELLTKLAAIGSIVEMEDHDDSGSFSHEFDKLKVDWIDLIIEKLILGT